MPPEAMLTADLIPQIWWQSRLDEAFDSLCYSEEPSWQTLLPYIRLLGVDLEPGVAGREMRLLERLVELRASVAQVEEDIALLSPKLGKPPQGMLEALGRLSHIAQSGEFPDFYALIQDEYASPDMLAEDLSLLRSLLPLKDMASEVLAVKSYLDAVVLRESDGELAMDRISILEQLTLENLLTNLHLWASVRALFDWFRSRYQALYLAHHHHYHSEMASFSLVLDDSKPEVDALRRLNSITELGQPVGQWLFEEYERLLAQAKPCPLMDSVSVEDEPVCPHCRLVLTAEPPKREVERLLRQLKQAIAEQHRRLSSEAVRQILAQSGEKRIDQFIKVVQTSDLSHLVNVLDDELVDFLRKLLREGR
jgi:hypothetical protein